MSSHHGYDAAAVNYTLHPSLESPPPSRYHRFFTRPATNANQICTMLRSSIWKGMPTAAPDAADSPAESGPRRKASRYESETGNTTTRGRGSSSRDMGQSAAAGQAVSAAAAAADAEELFTDLELMEDSRAIDFSVRTFSGPSVSGGNGNGCGGGGGDVGGRAGGNGASSSGACGRSGGGSASKGSRALANTTFCRSSSGSSRPGNYYDWFVSKLEGKEMGIIRGDIDARGKSVKGGGAGAGGAAGGAGDGDDGGGLQTATLSELLEMVHNMVEELDVPDDGLSKDRHTQGEGGGALLEARSKEVLRA